MRCRACRTPYSTWAALSMVDEQGDEDESGEIGRNGGGNGRRGKGGDVFLSRLPGFSHTSRGNIEGHDRVGGKVSLLSRLERTVVGWKEVRQGLRPICDAAVTPYKRRGLVENEERPGND